MDIKPQNILLSDDGKCRLADFGLSRKIPPGELVQEISGTPEYTGKILVYNKKLKIDDHDEILVALILLLIFLSYTLRYLIMNLIFHYWIYRWEQVLKFLARRIFILS